MSNNVSSDNRTYNNSRNYVLYQKFSTFFVHYQVRLFAPTLGLLVTILGVNCHMPFVLQEL